MDDLSPGKRLRQAVAKKILRIPGAPNALAAKLIERSGFEAIYLSGAAFSAGVLAVPDVGLFTREQLVRQTTNLSNSTDLPLIVDADTGFGDSREVKKTVREIENAGAGAIQLEDQRMPKRCGHLSGKELVDANEMCIKIQMAADGRKDSDFVIIARTDARGVTSLEDALARANKYLEAGADWIFPEALLSIEEMSRFAEEIKAPLVSNMTEFGKSPLLSVEELSEIGFSAVIYPVTLLRIAAKAMNDAIGVIADQGSQKSLLDKMLTRAELYELLEYENYYQSDRSFFGGDSNL